MKRDKVAYYLAYWHICVLFFLVGMGFETINRRDVLSVQVHDASVKQSTPIHWLSSGSLIVILWTFSYSSPPCVQTLLDAAGSVDLDAEAQVGYNLYQSIVVTSDCITEYGLDYAGSFRCG